MCHDLIIHVYLKALEHLPHLFKCQYVSPYDGVEVVNLAPGNGQTCVNY